jgi:AraC-like DNA-binding protein
MTELPLQRFELFQSHDPDETREIVSRVFCDHKLNLVGTDHRLDARMHSHRIGQIVANYVSYGGEVLIEWGYLNTFYAIQIPISGRSLVQSGADRVYSTSTVASVISPTAYLRQRWSADCQQIILRIERSALHAHLRDLLGVPLWEPLVFEPEFNISEGLAASWARACLALVEELDQPDSLLFNHHSARHVEFTMMTGLLAAQPHNYSHLLHIDTSWAVPSRAVNVARTIIEAHPSWTHTVGSLASHAHVSDRTLQLAFREYMQMTPKAYLTKVRMERAHQDLYSASPANLTVARVAGRYGFKHVGRFAVEYKKRFGESPSETLRK